MATLKELEKKIVDFRDERDWEQFHTPKDLAVSLVLEAAEVIEHFQWKNEKEIQEYVQLHGYDIGEELADVLSYTLLLAHNLGIDLSDVFVKKLEKNAAKYPVEKARGKSTKYTEL